MIACRQSVHAVQKKLIQTNIINAHNYIMNDNNDGLTLIKVLIFTIISTITINKMQEKSKTEGGKAIFHS